MDKKDIRRRLPGWTVRFVLLLAFVCGVMIGVLKLAEKSGGPLREGLESHFSQLTGQDAVIGELKDITFFPDVRFDIRNLKFHAPGNPDTVTMSVAEMELAMPLWRMLFGPSAVKIFRIKDLRADAGVLTPRALRIDTLAIGAYGPEDEGKYALQGQGAYGPDAVSVHVPVDRTRDLYKLARRGRVDVSVGNLKLRASVDRKRRKTVLDDLELALGEDRIKGNLVLKGRGRLTLRGDMALGATTMHPDIVFRKEDITGSLEFKTLDLNDLESALRIAGAVGALAGERNAKEKGPAAEDKGGNMSLHVAIDALKSGDRTFGRLSFPVSSDGPQRFSAEPVSGQIAGGSLSGKISGIPKDNGQMKVDMDLSLRKVDFSALHDSFEGRADARVTLSGTGRDGTEILGSAKGKAGLIAGEGRMNNAGLLALAGGLVNAMLPDLASGDKTVMNCGIADFAIQDGIAESQTVFFDFRDLTVVGDGIIDLRNQTIDLKLKPDSKNPELLKIATDVRIKGPWGDPSVGPDTLSLAGKIGGLLLGAVNPAFLVFSLTDLGLSDNHPCAKYVQGENGKPDGHNEGKDDTDNRGDNKKSEMEER